MQAVIETEVATKAGVDFGEHSSTYRNGLPDPDLRHSGGSALTVDVGNAVPHGSIDDSACGVCLTNQATQNLASLLALLGDRWLTCPLCCPTFSITVQSPTSCKRRKP